MSRPLKTTISLVMLAAAILVWLAWQERSADFLRVDYFAVGQGDASLITVGCCYQVLIDGGPDSTVLEKLGTAMPVGDRQIEVVVLTHPHSDHLAGLLEVVEHYQVTVVYQSAFAGDSAEFQSWQKAISQHSIETVIIDHPQRLSMGAAHLDFIYPRDRDFTAGDANDASIVNRLSWGAYRFLFTGDLEAEGEQRLLDGDYYLASNFLKVGHHGSDTSTSDDFLRAVGPQRAIVSVGAENRYGHPVQSTLDKLTANSVTIWRTDQQGDLSIIIDDQGLRETR